MSSALEPGVRAKRPLLDESDPWCYGWRYIKETQADGKTVTRQVPLKKEDLLYPQEDDFVVQNPLHTINRQTLQLALTRQLAHRPGYLCLEDCRTDFGVEGLQALGPDFGVYSGVHGWRPTQAGTFYVARWHAQPVAVIEVTSPTTLEGDLAAKVGLYYRAGVPLYVIVHTEYDDEDVPTVQLLCYRRGPNRYVLERRPELERLWLEPLNLWLVVENELVGCYDEQGQRIGDPLKMMDEVAEANQRAETETSRAETEKARAEAEKARADSEKTRADSEKANTERETKLRQEAEARLQAMADELRRLRGQ